ncbi:TPM domain-containing protein [Ottowia pentelensis]|uniref:TPM domain-containing protein n=1 Tax=Ottowia pentelensis TaxID=511108 RepID=A0ABV6PNJ4_9BURK
MLATLHRLWRHHWMDESDTRRLVPPDAVERLRRRVAESEARHSGQLRICVEAGLPASYLWRHLRRHLPMQRIVRERALMMFSKLGVWNTEHNNGVLIYLLLAERAIEVVADRGVARAVDATAWQALTDRLGRSLHAGQVEDGLSKAVDDVSARLVALFPAADGGAARPANELPDEPVLL